VDPVLLPAGDGETITNESERIVQIKAEFAEVAAANPGSLPDPETMARLAAKYDFEPLP
jgi:hypothetical protein